MLKETICCTSHKLGAELGKIHDRACRQIKSNRTLISSVIGKIAFLGLLRAKKRLKDLDGITFNLPRDNKIFINETLCSYYRGLWNKFKCFKCDNKIHQFYTNNGIIGDAQPIFCNPLFFCNQFKETQTASFEVELTINNAP